MKLKLLTGAVVMALASQPVLAAEEMIHEGAYVGGFLDYYWADWENNIPGAPAGVDLDESFGGGLEAGYRFNEYWTARLEWAAMNLHVTHTSQEKSGDRYGVDVLYHFNDAWYGFLGAKKLDFYDDFNAANLGVGYRHYFNPNWALSGELAWYHGLNETHDDVDLKLGINYFFGSASAPMAKPAPAPEPAPMPVKEAPKDSDGDGVTDDMDKCMGTPMEDAVDADGCTVYRDKTEAVNLLVHFPNDKAIVSDKFMADIQAVADFMDKHMDTQVELQGHTSAVGDADYNMKLSQKRADKVAAKLKELGISESRITAVGKGETMLKNPANTPAAHAENRRVEAHISSTEKVKVMRQ